MPAETIPLALIKALVYIRNLQDGVYGVIVPAGTAASLKRRQLAEDAPRRPWSRATGQALRLTPRGIDTVRTIA